MLDPLSFTAASDSEELRELQRMLRKFTDSLGGDPEKSTAEHRRELFNRMGELGLTGAAISEQFGGSALPMLAVATISFELARRQLGPAVFLSVHSMVSRLIQLDTVNPNFRKTLRELATGQKLAAFCLTEAQAGSDASALRTRAIKQGGRYELNGEKIYITSAGEADIYLVFARTDDDPKRGISAFVVERDTPGLSFGNAERKMGCESSPIGNVKFERCLIDESSRVLNEGDGYKIALSGLAAGRINIAAQACGLASRATELAAQYLLERKQFGQALAEFQGLQFMLADMYQQLRASVLVTRDAAQNLTPDPKSALSASVAKCFASDAAMKITTDAVQIFGGAGYLKDYEVERLMRDAKMLQIVEGTNQIQRSVIAREILKNYR